MLERTFMAHCKVLSCHLSGSTKAKDRNHFWDWTMDFVVDPQENELVTRCGCQDRS
jgi:hypothetical protein